MTVILKGLPGLSTRELIEAVQETLGPDVEIRTGHGGIVLPELAAYTILGAYLSATGAVAPPRVPVPEEPLPAAQPDRAPAGKTTKRGATRQKVGESS
jgi:hypothetical protein